MTEQALPKVMDEGNSAVVEYFLRAGAERLLAEFRDAPGAEREELRDRLRRFRAETLAALLAGPHIPMGKGGGLALMVVGQIDDQVAQALREP